MSIDVRIIGNRIRQFRERVGLDHSALARMTGLSRAYIYRLESGAVLSPKLGDLEQIAASLGVSVTDIINPSLPADIAEALTQLGRYPELAEDLALLIGALGCASGEERDVTLATMRALIRRLAERHHVQLGQPCGAR